MRLMLTSLIAATLAVAQPAYIVASVVGACGLAIGTPIVLAWEQRRERCGDARGGRMVPRLSRWPSRRWLGDRALRYARALW